MNQLGYRFKLCLFLYLPLPSSSLIFNCIIWNETNPKGRGQGYPFHILPWNVYNLVQCILLEKDKVLNPLRENQAFILHPGSVH